MDNIDEAIINKKILKIKDYEISWLLTFNQKTFVVEILKN